ncbi:sensor histidine kinase [Schwartzia succinivorans]|jgi:signal transduction histidine kinase|uniref:histidine kinase n=1 Tax=Schwartzia succinivorans DSM 10502 TaxID=1123243 RepID=A0A1M5ADI7_9FIRM|nr:HAMP domain-containing sensor histidine kinase [Schwartzia succinivorans]SHF28215.1 His Kinase A (phospho-acceptor) domain-containing protein [Schwartzia succinivorans DSM 10502]
MPKLAKRLFLYFSAALIVFTIVLAGLFDTLMRDASIKENRTLLENRTRALAASLTEESAAQAPSTAQENRRGMSGRQRGMHMRGMHHADNTSENSSDTRSNSYCRRYVSEADTSKPASAEDASYLKNLSALAGGTVWLVDRRSKTITAYGPDDKEIYDALPSEAENMLNSIYEGSFVSSEGFNDLLDAPSFTAGAPIKNTNGEVTGALLVHRTFSGLAESERSGLKILAAAIASAFVLSLVLSLILARRFVRPLARMEKTAAVLADGNYSERTDIRQDDEVGSLARSIDTLAERLSEAEKERERLEKMRRDFLSSVSHELRTPLTVLRGTVDLLSSGIEISGEKRRSLLEQTMSQTSQLERLVNDLFELTRLENPDFTIEKSQGSITDALEDAVSSANRIASKKNIAIKAVSPIMPVIMDMDYGRIRQMFLIVLDNAVKFSPADGEIELSLQSSDSGWSVSIRDHGQGIPEDILPELFGRFRSHKGENNPNGTGLGLAIAKQIANRHGIELTAKNAESGGAVFTFSKS